MLKHIAVCRVSTELADSFRSNLPSDTRIVSESCEEYGNETWFKLENESFYEVEQGMILPFVKAIFSREVDGAVKFIGWIPE